MKTAIIVVVLIAFVAGLWLFLQKKLRFFELLAVWSAALAIMAGSELIPYYAWFKPLTVFFLMLAVWVKGLSTKSSVVSGNRLLILALLFSFVGDVVFGFPGMFLEGLAAYLIAQIFYVFVFKQKTNWFPDRKVLVLLLVIGLVVYALLWRGIHADPILAVAVAVYTLVISSMAAQAIGQAMVKSHYAAFRGVALGACFFMLSDFILAWDKFVSPIAHVNFLNIVPYYLAQILIACFVLRSTKKN